MFFFISLVSDFLAVGFSVSSGGVRGLSVSTYATILVLPLSYFYKPFGNGKSYKIKQAGNFIRKALHFSNFEKWEKLGGVDR